MAATANPASFPLSATTRQPLVLVTDIALKLPNIVTRLIVYNDDDIKAKLATLPPLESDTVRFFDYIPSRPGEDKDGWTFYSRVRSRVDGREQILWQYIHDSNNLQQPAWTLEDLREYQRSDMDNLQAFWSDHGDHPPTYTFWLNTWPPEKRNQTLFLHAQCLESNRMLVLHGCCEIAMKQGTLPPKVWEPLGQRMSWLFWPLHVRGSAISRSLFSRVMMVAFFRSCVKNRHDSGQIWWDSLTIKKPAKGSYGNVPAIQATTTSGALKSCRQYCWLAGEWRDQVSFSIRCVEMASPSPVFDAFSEMVLRTRYDADLLDKFARDCLDRLLAQQTAEETQRVSQLTILAAIFIPLSLSSSILSMNVRFRDLDLLLYDFVGVSVLLSTLAIIAYLAIQGRHVLFGSGRGRRLFDFFANPVRSGYPLAVMVYTGLYLLCTAALLAGMWKSPTWGGAIFGIGFLVMVSLILLAGTVCLIPENLRRSWWPRHPLSSNVP